MNFFGWQLIKMWTQARDGKALLEKIITLFRSMNYANRIETVAFIIT